MIAPKVRGCCQLTLCEWCAAQVRITKTLNLGPYLWYGGVILGIELLGATTVLVHSCMPPAACMRS